MAPVEGKLSPLIVERVKIAGVEVNVLFDTRAMAYCCRWGWYKQNATQLGPLTKTDVCVLGVENRPVGVKGVTGNLHLEWDSVMDSCRLLVLSTFQDYDVLLGMDVLRRIQVRIDTDEGSARPQLSQASWQEVKLIENVCVPAGKSKVFFLESQVKGLTLFEPGTELPEGLRGVPTLNNGPKIAVQVDNPFQGFDFGSFSSGIGIIQAYTSCIFRIILQCILNTYMV